jgi:glycosyltransferase involved in cell wall biosynthesis
MKLLMLSGDIATAQGREGVFFNTLRLLSGYWERIDVLCPKAPGSAPRLVHGNVHVRPSPWHKAFQALFALRAGGRLLEEHRHALIVSHDYGVFSNGVAAMWLSRSHRVPYVSEIHHVEGYPRAASAREELSRRLATTYIRLAGRRAAGIRVVNEVEVPRYLKRIGVPEEKILMLPSLYIDFDVFKPMPGEAKLYDVLFVGRLVANKGILTILEAVAGLRAQGAEVRLCILGEGPLRRRLDERIGRAGLGDRVTIIERVATAADVATLYNRAKMLVCASTGEGGPRVTVEALACGTPVITTPVGIMPELIDDGRNGLIFNWDAGELAQKISLLLADEHLRTHLGEAGRHAVSGFEADVVVDRLASAYQAIARRAA